MYDICYLTNNSVLDKIGIDRKFSNNHIGKLSSSMMLLLFTKPTKENLDFILFRLKSVLPDILIIKGWRNQ